SCHTTTTPVAPAASSETTTTTEEPVESSETTTTTEEPPVESSETTTTSGVVKPHHEYNATWTIGKVDGVAGHPVEVPITVSANIAEALTYNLYDFKIKVQDGPVFNPTALRSGSAYSEMTIQANGMEIAATNLNGDSVGYNNAVVIYLTFDLPEDLPAGKYAVEFDGDVEAHNRNLDTFDITEENGQILVIPDGVYKEQIEFQYNLESLSKFYFSHDHRTFIGDGLLKEDLISIGTLMARPVYSDPALTEEAEWTVADLDKIEFNLKDAELESPKAIFDKKVEPTLDGSDGIAFFKEKIAFTLSTTFTTLDAETGELVEKEQKDVDTLYDGSPIVTGDVYIGVKGDTDLNGTVNAYDAAKDLVYAADFGAGLDPKILTVTSDMITAIQAEGEEAATALENFVYFLSDVTDESEDHGETSSILDSDKGGEAINAADAAKVLVYTAEFGAGLYPDWYVLLDKPLPRYTEAIGPRPADTTE
ncbi:MAG: hypothetical protein K2H82_09810, partial [Oscillospiraceae bacterium]|nr:hypothetical protein [Oscillospiraceae bacterium]